VLSVPTPEITAENHIKLFKRPQTANGEDAEVFPRSEEMIENELGWIPRKRRITGTTS